jgi:hypothetical protein
MTSEVEAAAREYLTGLLNTEADAIRMAEAQRAGQTDIIERLEPGVANHLLADQHDQLYLASIAISLKRIAYQLEIVASAAHWIARGTNSKGNPK